MYLNKMIMFYSNDLCLEYSARITIYAHEFIQHFWYHVGLIISSFVL